MTNRNGFIELMRFIFALTVVGYHLRNFELIDFGAFPIFNFGYFAVEFFFILSGFFLAKTIDKQRQTEPSWVNLPRETAVFMGKKIKSFLPLHIVAIVGIIVVIAAFQPETLGQRILDGLPNVFLVQTGIVWRETIDLIKPEWYLSAMLIIFLITYPTCRLLSKKLKGARCVAIMFGVVAAMCLISGFATEWTLFSDLRYWNLQQLIRSFGEIVLGMLCYHISVALSRKPLSDKGKIFVTVTAVSCYFITILLVNLPAIKLLTLIGQPIAMILFATAITLNFSCHDLIAEKCVAGIFGYLGSLSLPIYLFHTVVIEFFLLANFALPQWATGLLVFVISTGSAMAVNALTGVIKKYIKKIRIERRNHGVFES